MVLSSISNNIRVPLERKKFFCTLQKQMTPSLSENDCSTWLKHPDILQKKRKLEAKNKYLPTIFLQKWRALKASLR